MQLTLAILCGVYLMVGFAFLIVLTTEAIKENDLMFFAKDKRILMLLTLLIFFGAIGWLGLVLAASMEDET